MGGEVVKRQRAERKEKQDLWSSKGLIAWRVKGRCGGVGSGVR